MSDKTETKAEWTARAVQDARSLFVTQLRSRLHEINPEGVGEFRVAWSSLAVDAAGTLPLSTLEYQVTYGSEGSAECNGTDRGRRLGMMDTELSTALMTETQSATTGTTTIFWSVPESAPVTMSGDRVERVATVEILSYQGGK